MRWRSRVLAGCVAGGFQALQPQDWSWRNASALLQACRAGRHASDRGAPCAAHASPCCPVAMVRGLATQHVTPPGTSPELGVCGLLIELRVPRMQPMHTHRTDHTDSRHEPHCAKAQNHDLADRAARQLPAGSAEASLACQRWSKRRALYRPVGEPFDPSRCDVQPIDEAQSKAYIGPTTTPAPTLRHVYVQAYSCGSPSGRSAWWA